MPLNLGSVIMRKKTDLHARTRTSDVKTYIEKNKPEYRGNLAVKIKTSDVGTGEIVGRDEFFVLRLKGTQFEMGYQHGYLLADVIHKKCGNPEKNLISFWSDYLENEMLKPVIGNFGPLVDLARSVLCSYTEEAKIADRLTDNIFRAVIGMYEGYIQGIKDRKHMGQLIYGDMIDLMQFVKGCIQPDVILIMLNRAFGGGSELIKDLDIIPFYGLKWPEQPLGALGCTSAAIMPPKTEDERLLFGCNFDYTPLAGLYEKNLTVSYFDPLPEDKKGKYNPRGKKPLRHVGFTIPGMPMAAVMGVNECGVAFRVHVNGSGDTDNNFNQDIPHGQPLFNFCTETLRRAEDITGGEDSIEKFIKTIKTHITLPPEEKNKVTDSPASGWSFIFSQLNGEGEYISIIRETTFIDHRSNHVPDVLKDQNSNRFAVIKDLPEIKQGGDIQAIWQTNFYTSPDLDKTEVFRCRSEQLDYLNRFIRMGQMIREKYEAGGITWKDVATMLADDRDIFVGNQRRLNYKTIASVATITTIVYSMAKGADGKPEIVFHLARKGDWRTPMSWGKYYRFDFKDFYKNDLCSYYTTDDFAPLQCWSDDYCQAMAKFYDAYCFYTFGSSDEQTTEEVLELLKEARNIIGGGVETNPKEPFVDHLLGRINCNRGWFTKAITYFERCIDRCLAKGEDGTFEFYDPHLLTVTYYFLAKAYFCEDTPESKARAMKVLREINKTIYFENMPLQDDLMAALKPYIEVKNARAKKLKYIQDSRLKEAISKLKEAGRCQADEVETEINFYWPDPTRYLYPDK